MRSLTATGDRAARLPSHGKTNCWIGVCGVGERRVFEEVFGTSAAAPEFAGLFALMSQAHRCAYGASEMLQPRMSSHSMKMSSPKNVTNTNPVLASG